MPRNRPGPGALVALAVITALMADDAAGKDWPQFRGPERDGISREAGLLASWPEGGPPEVWRRPIGEGYSGLSVVGERLYTMFAADGKNEPMEFAAAFDAQTGRELWRTPIGKKFHDPYGNGPRSTPTVEGERLYVLGSYGDLASLQARDGSVVWKLSLTETFGSKVPNSGFSMSTLVDGEQLIVEGGGPAGKSYAALDKNSGKVRWTFGDGRPGYSSPLTIAAGGEPCYVHFGRNRLSCMNQYGTKVWSRDWPAVWTNAMPLFVPPDKIFGSAAEGAGAVLFQVRTEEGVTTVEEVWAQPLMRNLFTSSVYLDGYIYGFDQTALKCISAADGEMAWAKRALGRGNLIAADGHLVVLGEKGELVLLEASPEAYKEKGALQALEGQSWTLPTLANGRLYLRNHTEMVSYDVKGGATPAQ